MTTAQRLADALRRYDQKIIFAESCTAGLASATLAKIPGISAHLCGSFVTYRPRQKMDALGISDLNIKTFTTESSEIAREMAIKALGCSSEADWSAAIVGHLGPNAPPEKDGIIWMSLYDKSRTIYVHEIDLNSTGREERMTEAAECLLSYAASIIGHEPFVRPELKS